MHESYAAHVLQRMDDHPQGYGWMTGYPEVSIQATRTHFHAGQA
jgi:hypothetical protein